MEYFKELILTRKIYMIKILKGLIINNKLVLVWIKYFFECFYVC